MIESTVTKQAASPAKSLFPSLRIDSEGLIYLFTKKTNGKCSPVIGGCLEPENVGYLYTSADLNDPDDLKEYKLFEGTVTLSNVE